jgi:hypothetical protein
MEAEYHHLIEFPFLEGRLGQTSPTLAASNDVLEG